MYFIYHISVHIDVYIRRDILLPSLSLSLSVLHHIVLTNDRAYLHVEGESFDSESILSGSQYSGRTGSVFQMVFLLPLLRRMSVTFLQSFVKSATPCNQRNKKQCQPTRIPFRDSVQFREHNGNRTKQYPRAVTSTAVGTDNSKSEYI